MDVHAVSAVRHRPRTHARRAAPRQIASIRSRALPKALLVRTLVDAGSVGGGEAITAAVMPPIVCPIKGHGEYPTCGGIPHSRRSAPLTPEAS